MAEAEIEFSCVHPGIYLTTMEDPNLNTSESSTNISSSAWSRDALPVIIIPPACEQLLTIVYVPETVEHLNAIALIKSSDSRSNIYSVHLKGVVGLSKLSIEPDNCLDVHFGVCEVFGRWFKEIVLVNGGNIAVSFQLQVSALDPMVGSEVISIEPLSGVIGLGASVSVKVSVDLVPTTALISSF